MAERQSLFRFIGVLTNLFSKVFLRAILFLIFIGDSVIAIPNFLIRSISYSIRPLIRIGKKLSTVRFPNFSRLFTLTIPFKVRYFLLGVLFACIAFGIHQAHQFVIALPNPRLIGAVNYPVSSKIYDRNGILLYEMYHEQNRTPVTLKQIPQIVRQATIAVEDKDFYNHRGISIYGGVLRAIKEMIMTHQLEGGSTITQQLVKTSLLTPERTLQRKIREAFLAVWVERVYSKDQILEMYFNQVSYGGAAYGIQEAANTYFGKDVEELQVGEAAFLAGLPQAPSYYSPYTNPRLAQKRRDEVLKRMEEEKYINEEEYKQAGESPLVIKEPKDVIKAPHFVFYVKSLLEKKYGTRRVEEGGLRIYTSLDVNLQQNAQDILGDELTRLERLHVTNGAVLVTVPSTGEILTMVGSKNYFETPYGAFNVTTASRQPGSSIKPLMYSLALERSYTAASIIEDNPVIFKSPGAKPFKPVNYDGKYHGKVTLRYALANSYNIPAVKVLNSLGVVNFIEHARLLGITTWLDPSRYGLALTLGGGDVTMTDMSTAFGTFANDGERVDLNPILKIEDYRGNVIYSRGSDFYKQPKRILSEHVAYIISNILSDSTARKVAFGPNSRLDIPGYSVAVKTGTTNDKRDNWTIGYTPKYLTAVWVGNNDNTPMNQALVSGITGAAPIWNRVMTTVLKTNIKPTTKKEINNSFVKPVGIVEKQCYFGKVEYFVPGTESLVNCYEPLFNLTSTPADQP